MSANTPQQARARELAEQACNSLDGIIVRFTVERCGSLQQANSAARGFQIAFCALRAKERRRAMTHVQDKWQTVDTDVKGPYDHIACTKTELAHRQGYQILLCQATTLDFATDVVNARTGEPLVQFTVAQMRLEAIMARWSRAAYVSYSMKRAFVNPLSVEEEAEFFTLDAVTAAEFYRKIGLPLPSERQGAHAHEPAPDLADFDLSEWTPTVAQSTDDVE